MSLLIWLKLLASHTFYILNEHIRTFVEQVKPKRLFISLFGGHGIPGGYDEPETVGGKKKICLTLDFARLLASLTFSEQPAVGSSRGVIT